MNVSNLMKSYCMSREMTSHYAELLETNISDIEKDIVYDLLLNSVHASNTIKSLCERKFDDCVCTSQLTNKY